MKELLPLLLLVIIAFGCSGDQKEDVPQEVLDAFAQQYPSATEVTWEYKQEHYEVDFMYDGREMEAEYDQSGNLGEVEYQLETNQLPQFITDHINAKYGSLEVQEASLEINSTDSTYQVELKESTFKTREIEFDTEGNLVKDGISED